MHNDDLADLLGRVLRQMTDQGEPPVRGRSRPSTAPPPVVRAGAPAPQAARPAKSNVVLEAEVVDAVSASGEDVARHVAQHRFAQDVSEHASHLGGAVTQELEAMQAHQRQLFGAGPQGRLSASSTDASTGRSGSAGGAEGDTGKSAAQTIAAMLRSKDSLRGALILGEILKRPSW